MRSFSREALAEYNGKDGAPAYVAYAGRVYAVSGSFVWRNGRHWVRHQARADLTDGLRDASHGPELLSRYPCVGMLE
jgi:predicted heme/steroid binding protein